MEYTSSNSGVKGEMGITKWGVGIEWEGGWPNYSNLVQPMPMEEVVALKYQMKDMFLKITFTALF